MVTDSAETTRERIVAAATDLLERGGSAALSTRAVSAAAGTQAPTLYRLFGDKQGLLDAVAAEGFAAYLQDKLDRVPVADPVDDLRAGWDLHVGFGLAHPALYPLLYGRERPGRLPPAADAAFAILARKIGRIAAAGRLRVGEERAGLLVHAAGRGTTLTLIALPQERRDRALSALAREAVIAAITTDASAPEPPGVVGAALALRAALPEAAALSPAERTLMREWLERVADAD